MTSTPVVAGLMALVLAVPGGCIREPVHYGTLTIMNRTRDRLVVHAQYATTEEIFVEPCETWNASGFPLNAVTVDPADPADPRHPVGIGYGVATGDILMLAVAGSIEAVREAPSPLPECNGHL